MPMNRSQVVNLHPHNLIANSEKRGFDRAIKLFRETAKHVPAYRHFLKRHKVVPSKIKTQAEFTKIPQTTRSNYISKYSIEELSWNGSLDSARYISSSSGSTGLPLYWSRGQRQDQLVSPIFQRIYEDMFGTKNGNTLYVNSFALGTWIAGLEHFNATKWTAERGSNIVITTPGIEKELAIDTIKRLASPFERIVLAGYPPFVKDIIELGDESGIDWTQWDTRLLTGGEAFSETWRDRILKLIGQEDNLSSFINMFGMAETGIVAHETPLSILLRRLLRGSVKDDGHVSYSKEVMGLYQYYPTTRYYEMVGKDSLIMTADTGFPLIRYSTRDRGGLLDRKQVTREMGTQLIEEANSHNIDLRKWQMPFVYLFGRKDLSVSLYALNIYVENIKQAFEDFSVSSYLSGLFIMSVEYNTHMDQRLLIVLELSRGVDPSPALKRKLTLWLIEQLCRLNIEYARLYASVGKRAVPHIKLVRNGKIHTTPGRKHRWIKRR
jgi:phenylacetate-CoA ligase